ncbi:MAG: tRNA lysidine(34) synthetase TilS [Pirellulaceae bacterium]
MTTVLAVSGGADSVSLLRGVLEIALSGTSRIVVAHYNHGLRGPESDADERFVGELCTQLDVKFAAGRAAPGRFERCGGEGLESAAREARYAFLKTTSQQQGARFVATGHTADDQAETLLHRIVRGTGLRGLGGIPRTRLLSQGITLIRPLLSFRRWEIQAYLAAIDQEYRHDASNQDAQFTRNRIRHDLMPRLASDYNPEVVQSLLRLGSIARETQFLVDAAVDDLLDRCLARNDARGVEVDCEQLAGSPTIVVCDLLIALWNRRAWPQRDMGFERWNELAELALATPRKSATTTLPGGIRARREGNVLRIDNVGR